MMMMTMMMMMMMIIIIITININSWKNNTNSFDLMNLTYLRNRRNLLISLVVHLFMNSLLVLLFRIVLLDVSAYCFQFAMKCLACLFVCVWLCLLEFLLFDRFRVLNWNGCTWSRNTSGPYLCCLTCGFACSRLHNFTEGWLIDVFFIQFSTCWIFWQTDYAWTKHLLWCGWFSPMLNDHWCPMLGVSLLPAKKQGDQVWETQDDELAKGFQLISLGCPLNLIRNVRIRQDFNWYQLTFKWFSFWIEIFSCTCTGIWRYARRSSLVGLDERLPPKKK